MGGIAFLIGVWVIVYLAGHRSLEGGSQAMAAAAAVACFGFAAYVAVRRVTRGPQH